jgi:nucleoside-diphosphate-sugar epimerase
MAGSLFITGASGFLGRHFLSYCERHWHGGIVCLSRQARTAGQGTRIRWVTGDLLSPASYANELGPDTTVVHLAAVTGKASRAAYQQTNTDGTAVLVRACVERGVHRFVLVSSVAARYPNLKSYPYGASKRDAEQVVAASGLAYLIVRPTIVLGRESPIWQKLSQLAAARLVPVIGTGRTRVQPIHVRDVAMALGELAHDVDATGTIELAGAEALSIRDLLERIHRVRHGRSPVVLKIPYPPLRVALQLMEKSVPRLLPITAGQLSLFVHDSNVTADGNLKAMWPHMMSVDEMIRASEHGNA